MSAARRHPPAFQVDVQAQTGLQRLVAVLAAVSAYAFVAALAAHVPALGWLAIPCVPVAAGLGHRLARSEARRLAWDGQTWRLAPAAQQDAGPAVRIEVLMDFGDWLLLRAQAPGWRSCRVYLPLGRSAVGPGWGALRATLYSARAELPEFPHPG